MNMYEAVIGLEVHVQLSTSTKIFCGCPTKFGAAPNTHICPVCTGQPGSLPVLNRQAVEYALRVAVALGCKIESRSRFARKNYFYPDLPKGYQISQYEQPLAIGGSVAIDDGQQVCLTRIHLEEDAGKSLHQGPSSRVDLNRAGVPLIEIVSEPEIRQPQAAAQYMRTLRSIVRALGVSDGNMEQGSLRCDANVSLRPVGCTTLGVKTEVKNLNSFRFVQRALEYEIERQRDLLVAGEQVVQETRLWDEEAGVTQSMRSKEEAHDYRYFPDPDLPPIQIAPHWVERVTGALPELPLARRQRYVRELGLSERDADQMTRERELSEYFEATIAAGASAKRAANWIMTQLLSQIPDPRAVTDAPVSPRRLAGLLGLWDAARINSKLAKKLWPLLWETDDDAEVIAEREGLFQETDFAGVETEVRRVVNANPSQVAQYRAGKEKVFGFFVGQVMRATRGKADPQLVNSVLRQLLSEGQDPT